MRKVVKYFKKPKKVRRPKILSKHNKVINLIFSNRINLSLNYIIPFRLLDLIFNIFNICFWVEFTVLVSIKHFAWLLDTLFIDWIFSAVILLLALSIFFLFLLRLLAYVNVLVWDQEPASVSLVVLNKVRKLNLVLVVVYQYSIFIVIDLLVNVF